MLKSCYLNLLIRFKMSDKKSIWPTIWAIVRYAVTALLGYLAG